MHQCKYCRSCVLPTAVCTFKIQTKTIIALAGITTHRNMLWIQLSIAIPIPISMHHAPGQKRPTGWDFRRADRLTIQIRIDSPRRLLRSCATCELFLRLSQIQFNCDNNKIYSQQFVSLFAKREFSNIVAGRQRIIIMCLTGSAWLKLKLYNHIHQWPYKYAHRFHHKYGCHLNGQQRGSLSRV